MDLVKYFRPMNYYRWLHRKINERRFESFGKNSIILRPVYLRGEKNISIGTGVYIHKGIYLETIDYWPVGEERYYSSRIDINDNVYIGPNCHITCANRIFIGKGCSILSNVLITDIEHIYRKGYSLRETGINVGNVWIGNYTTIGMGARILGVNGIKIGNNCVIGANAVVTKDVEDCQIVAGVPAKVIGMVE